MASTKKFSLIASTVGYYSTKGESNIFWDTKLNLYHFKSRLKTQ
jgi:hypothetical protein